MEKITSKTFKSEVDFQTTVSEKLQGGICIFLFEKSDGTHRRAIGTINPNLIPYPKQQVDNLVRESLDFLTGFGTDTLIKGDDEKLGKALEPFRPKEPKDRKVNETVQSFFDLESQSWKSYTKSKLIAYFE